MLTPKHAEFGFRGVLNRFLPPARRGRLIEFAFLGAPAVKDPVEALGVPHTEVGRVRIDGGEVGLAHRLRGGERVQVDPVFEPGTCAVAVPDGPATAFVLDVHLGQLARYLRLLGIDTWYDNASCDDGLLAVAMAGERRLLTRDTGLLKRTRGHRGAFVYATDPLWQLREAVDRFGLAGRLAPFTRCARCNAPVETVAPDEVRSRVPACAFDRACAFSRCTGCARVYWRGSHTRKLKERLAGVGIAI